MPDARSRSSRRRVAAGVIAVACLTGCEQVAEQAYDPPTEFASRGHEVDITGTGNEHRPGREAPATLDGKVLYGRDAGKLTAVDVTSGDTLWEAESRWGESAEAVDLPPPRIRVDGKWQVLAAFAGNTKGSGTSVGRRECEVFAVDADTGKKLWQVRFEVGSAGTAEASDLVPGLVGADERVAVVGYGSRTYAVDLRTRKVRWKSDAMTAVRVADGVVVGVTSRTKGATRRELLGVRTTDGKRAWRVKRGITKPVISAAGPGLVAVYANDYDYGKPVFALVRAKTGKTVDARGYQAHQWGQCRYDERSVTVCSASKVLFAYSTKSGKRLWTVATSARRVAPVLDSAYHGVVYGHLEDSRGRHTKRVMLDARTGKDRSGDPGIEPVLVSGFGALDVEGTPRVHRSTG